MYISLEASIGVGKSTLLPHLAKELGVTPVEEDLVTGSDFLTALGAFNEDKTKSFQLQITINKIRNKLAKSHMIGEYLTERSMLSDIVFTEVMHNSGFMTKNEFQLFQAMATANVMLNPPAVCVHLACDAQVAYDRMASRGRSEESTNDLQYMIDLEAMHENRLVEMCAGLDIPFIRIDYNNFVDAKVVADAINRMIFLREMR
tara:strand:- start:357 stop:965 length:609 start_codon:yes stop_codon:yes gene_type:complete